MLRSDGESMDVREVKRGGKQKRGKKGICNNYFKFLIPFLLT